jgi:phosphoribosylformimino-5-aminoimidazole carboxamide ribotide isomerase
MPRTDDNPAARRAENPVLLIPAIDLRGGQCVRLHQGSFEETTRYSADPVSVARGYADCGARWVHVVDLDAAEGRGADNLAVIERIRAALPCRLEVGGGVRTEEQAARLLSLGVDRIVLGTLLARSPMTVAGWTARQGRRFAAGVDARDGQVKVAGWKEDAGVADTEFAAGLSALGIDWLIYTNISRDGTLGGPDIPRTVAAARAAGLPTILSGGIGSERDIIEASETAEPLLVGVILGKALYERRIDLGSLIRRFPQAASSAWDPTGA